jgi:hypothetical protein
MTAELDDAATKIVISCDFHPKGKPKTFSLKNNIEYKEVIAAAKEAGWFMRPVNLALPRGEWLYCCPDCAATRLESNDIDKITEISSPSFARDYVREHE